ncbi:polysaccharide deacetylase family protein [Acanthopleuribacter pedis]|uniref:Polysaccharide deacetylase family protein n=1 Tax=Acanthopleuribacter pedis TaxID=442870 RepID=A0A8J7QGZ5_9BACT|nr:polysaccharide deacetylase family protein [Acanthopleuribacter pedis]MBO1322185.1 polysaccharide deacetylase family protein [Acanthopleuribacter pedis]
MASALFSKIKRRLYDDATFLGYWYGYLSLPLIPLFYATYHFSLHWSIVPAATVAALLAVDIGRRLSQTRLLGPIIRRVDTEEKLIALTFDDGPNPPFTEDILATLSRHEAKATFFMIGEQAAKHPDTVKAVLKQGSQVGNHGWTHRPLLGRTPLGVSREIRRTDHLLQTLGSSKLIPFRAPYAAQFISVPLVLALMQKPNVMFDVTPDDWRGEKAKVIADRVIKQIQPGSIVLLHDGGGDRKQTVLAVKTILRELSKQGYRFVTTETLMAVGPTQGDSRKD